MTFLTSYEDAAPHARRATLDDFDAIAGRSGTERRAAGALGSRRRAGPAGADDDILRAYARDIDRLKARGGYKSCDVLRLSADHPQREMLRAKFLAEHVHRRR